MLKTFFISLIWICFIPVSIAQNAAQQSDSLIAAFMADKQVPGLSISVSKNGDLHYSKGFGFADVNKTVPVDPARTKFRIGSVSKTLTASGLALLYEQGKIDLDASIDRYVPSWPEKSHPITLRLLAGHLAGIRHYRGSEFWSANKYETVTDGLAIFINDPLMHKPGSKYAYSSYGWNLISVAMENAAAPAASFLSAKNFLQFMQEDVFEALKMDNTVADHADQDIANRTAFFSPGRDKPVEARYVDNSYKWAGGGFVGTTEDLCRFGQAHMKGGFLKQATLDLWMQSQKTTDGKETNYGIGWRTYKRDSGQTFYGHSGGSVGGTTQFLIHKPTQTVLAITANLNPLGYGSLPFDLMELFINE